MAPHGSGTGNRRGLIRRDMELSALSNKSVTPIVKARADALDHWHSIILEQGEYERSKMPFLCI